MKKSKKCERCGHAMLVHTMSWFNTDMICTACDEEEEQHPLFKQAKEAEMREVQKKNYNYPGLFAGKTWDEIKEIKE
jgi:hypothetical protein